MTRRIVHIAITNEMSDFNCSFSLAHALATSGYRPIYILGSDDYRSYIESNGFEAKIIDSFPFETDNSKPVRQIVSEALVKDLSCFDSACRGEYPCLAIVGQLSAWMAVVYYCRHIPVIALCSSLANGWNSLTPPTYFDAVQGDVTFKSRIRNLKYWLRLFTRPHYASNNVHRAKELFFERFKRSAEGKQKNCAYHWRRLIAKNGGKLQWGEYGIIMDTTEFVTCPREFDFKRVHNAKKRHYLGTCILHNRNDDSSPFASEKTAEQNVFESLDKPIVYASIGTHDYLCSDRERFFGSVIDAVSARNDLHLIIAIASDDIRCKYGETSNVSIRKWVPQLEVLAKSAVFITHGGLSSIREAIYYSVPMIVLPFWNDGFGNAARIRQYNLGVSYSIADVSPAMIDEGLDEIMSNQKYRVAVDEMGKVFRSQMDCGSAIRVVDEVVANGSPV